MVKDDGLTELILTSTLSHQNDSKGFCFVLFLGLNSQGQSPGGEIIITK